jgi:hypothetical protein
MGALVWEARVLQRTAHVLQRTAHVLQRTAHVLQAAIPGCRLCRDEGLLGVGPALAHHLSARAAAVGGQRGHLDG